MTKVKVYSTPTCPYCNIAKDFLKQNKIAYEEVDVSVDKKAAEHMVEISKQMGVPVLEIGKEVIVGYDVAKIKKALNLK
ncbi:glutaredoxin family protein [Nanoarchaeota archaeon]